MKDSKTRLPRARGFGWFSPDRFAAFGASIIAVAQVVAAAQAQSQLAPPFVAAEGAHNPDGPDESSKHRYGAGKYQGRLSDDAGIQGVHLPKTFTSKKLAQQPSSRPVMRMRT